jgi:hypothetical protein
LYYPSPVAAVLEQTKSLPLLADHFQLFSLGFSVLCLLKHQEAAKKKSQYYTPSF